MKSAGNIILRIVATFAASGLGVIGAGAIAGISTAKAALQYLVMLYETLGPKWMSNEWFRFGASSLANDIILQLEKEAKGIYYSKDYISID
jgi:deoxyribose-phosphate aldolase